MAHPSDRVLTSLRAIAPNNNDDDNVLCQSLLHGSPEAKSAGDVEVQQHSRLVARGKYLHGFEGAPRSPLLRVARCG